MTPPQKPGRSKQDYGTPPEFLEAVKARLGISEFYCDLAASRTNSVAAGLFLTKEIDALSVPWTMRDGWCWLNPPYGDIAPWVRKAWGECTVDGSRIAVLVPAAVGSNWWREWVHGKAYVLFLNPRITFVGCTMPYPKDCALLIYDGESSGYDVWRWKPSTPRTATGDGKDARADLLQRRTG